MDLQEISVLQGAGRKVKICFSCMNLAFADHIYRFATRRCRILQIESQSRLFDSGIEAGKLLQPGLYLTHSVAQSSFDTSELWPAAQPQGAVRKQCSQSALLHKDTNGEKHLDSPPTLSRTNRNHYRRKTILGQIRRNFDPIFNELARQKKCRILEGHLMTDHYL